MTTQLPENDVSRDAFDYRNVPPRPAVTFPDEIALPDNRLAEPAPDHPAHKLRVVITDSAQRAHEQSMRELDQLIEQIQQIKDELTRRNGVITEVMVEHFDFVAEVGAFTDKIRTRLAQVREGTGNGSN